MTAITAVLCFRRHRGGGVVLAGVYIASFLHLPRRAQTSIPERLPLVEECRVAAEPP